VAEDKSKHPELLVRGISIISTREYLKSRLEGPDWKIFVNKLPVDVREVISSASKSEWYPFTHQRLLREEIVRLFNPSSPRQAILDAYLFATRYEISAFLRGIFSFLPVKLVLARAAAVWDKYYNMGDMTAVFTSEKSASLELRDFPGDRLFCPTVEAWLVNAAKYLNLANPRVEETSCVHSGDSLCSWRVLWD